jgi:hypothetical protein
MTTEHTIEEFYDLAIKEFGEKFTMKPIQISDDNLIKLNSEFGSTLTKEQISEYKQVWLLENNCPACGAPLGGLFGSFEWGIRHGEGDCSECHKIILKLYHYIGDMKRPFEAYALSGF